MPVTLQQLYTSQTSKQAHLKWEGTLLSLDPGETTGWALWEMVEGKVTLLAQGQEKTWPEEVGLQALITLIEKTTPTRVVFESYQVYEWKTDDHSWSQVPTVQVIGMLKTLLMLRKIPYSSQTAQVAKQFVTDERLLEWGYWFKGIKHARDAIRHGIYYLLFGQPKPKN